MAYNKQNFADGQVLKAEHLNHIEDGIEDAINTAEKSVSFKYQNLTDTQKSQARTNIGALGQSDIESATNTALAKAKTSGEFDGADGKDGIDGKDGENGKTPYIQNGYWYIDGVNTNVKAQGADGKNGVDGTDGKNGLDGYTPVKGKDYFDGKDGLPGADGKDGANGKDGQPGKDGVDGKTPVKGADYFTEDDISEMVQAVITALPKYNGEVIEL